MLRTILPTVLLLAIAIGGGAASVYYALAAQGGPGAVTRGTWTTFPELGTRAADPYSKARIARQGVLALGLAEGLTFTASRDAGGAALRRECRYRIAGAFPVARFWTLYAADSGHRVLPLAGPRKAALQSLAALRQPDDTLTIDVGARAEPGNWLAVSGSGPMTLVLTLYDTPSTNSAGVGGIVLPEIRRTGCDA